MIEPSDGLRFERTKAILAVCAVLATTSSRAAPAEAFRVRDLGALDRTTSYFSDLNEVGQVAGTTSTRANYRAYFWDSRAGMLDVGTLGGVSSQASALNRLGEVVGWSHTNDGGIHAFLWSRAGGLVDLGEGTAAFVNNAGMVAGVRYGTGEARTSVWIDGQVFDIAPSGAVALNDAGEVLGSTSGCWIWNQETGVVDVGTPGVDCFPKAINSNGQAVGATREWGSDFVGFLWDRASGMVALPVRPGAQVVTPLDINDDGWITGYYYRDGAYRCFLWTPATLDEAIPTQDGTCQTASINSRGEIAGMYSNAGGTQAGFYWSRATGVIPLSPLRSGRIVKVGEISDSGIIAGESTNRDGVTRAVIWTR